LELELFVLLCDAGTGGAVTGATLEGGAAGVEGFVSPIGLLEGAGLLGLPELEGAAELTELGEVLLPELDPLLPVGALGEAGADPVGVPVLTELAPSSDFAAPSAAGPVASGTVCKGGAGSACSSLVFCAKKAAIPKAKRKRTMILNKLEAELDLTGSLVGSADSWLSLAEASASCSELETVSAEFCSSIWSW
jgi:hypothetical protein